MTRALAVALTALLVVVPVAVAKGKKVDPPERVSATPAGDAATVRWAPAKAHKPHTTYEVSKDGAVVARTESFEATVPGLACGTTYELAVTAVWKGEDRSNPVAVRLTTADCPPPPPPPPSTVYVSPDGRDYAPRWVHLATTFDGSTLRFYQDGVEMDAVAASGAVAASNGPLTLGGNLLFGEFFTGAMDDVRVYSRALTPAELLADMLVAPTRAPGLVAAYTFDDGTATDVSESGNNGTLAGATPTADGKHGGALAFDGVDDMVVVPDADSLDLTSALTLEAWVNIAPPSGWAEVVSKQGDGTQPYGLWSSTDTSRPEGHVFIDRYYEARSTERVALNRCAKATPCFSFDAAYHAAAPGQEIEVAAGRYGSQVIMGTKAAPGVVIRPAAGAEVVAGSIDMHADRVEVRDIALEGGIAVFGRSDFATFRNVDTSAQLYIAGARDVSIIGGDVGPSVDAMSWITHDNGAIPQRVLIEGVRFHDFTASRPEVHTECMLVIAGDGITFRGNTFTNCAVFDLSFGICCDSPDAPTNVLIENNFFARSVSESGFTLHFNDNLNPIANYTIRNNSSAGPFLLDQSQASLTNVRVVGNTLEGAGCGRAEWTYNVFVGSGCDGTGNRVVADIGYLDAAAGDLHLKEDSPARDAGSPTEFPARDIDGDVRPLGGAPDAGADER